MKKNEKQLNWVQGLYILGIIWLLGAACDRLWFALDRSVPAWDQADYLNGALNYWEALQNPHLFDSNWWRDLWLLSPKIPPLTYILTVPFLNLFGVKEDAATLVMLLFSAILLVSVYGLGIELFSVSVGLWAAGLCQLLPGLYYYRQEFLLDYPLTAIVTFSFWLLTVWKIREQGDKETRRQGDKKTRKIFPFSLKNPSPFTSWLQAAAFGISFGLALMLKQTALFFLLIPIVWVFVATLIRRNWLRLAQLFGALCLSVFVFFPWYRTNWLLILTSGKRATVDSAIAEGDPALNTLDAWTYYGKILPYLLSWPLLLVAIVGLLIYWGRKKNWILGIANKKFNTDPPQPPLIKGGRRGGSHPCFLTSQFRWLLVFLLGGYFLSSLNINKDARYVLPLLPVLSLILAAGLLCWKGRWQNYVRWGTVGLGIILMLFNLFPLGGQKLTAILSPRVEHYPYLGQQFPHQEVVQEIIETSPYLRSTLGVLPSTPIINQHNFSFYGGQFHSQVVGRQVGVRENEVRQDARSLDWFLCKTGDQGSVPDAQAAIVKLVEESGDFKLQKSWQLSDDRTGIKLYHRLQPSVEVKPLSLTQDRVKLEQIIVPEKVPPGVPIPVTYRWSGSWEQLQAAIVILTWQSSGRSQGTGQWLHDHAIAMGALHPGRLNSNSLTNAFQVIERTAMLTEKTIALDKYVLTATYLNRETGETYPISVPPVTITIDPSATTTVAPELDLVTQLRTIAPNLAQGIKGLEPIFIQTARINQYDPVQDYLDQAQLALSYRLKQDHSNREEKLDWNYAIALSRVLKQDVEGAIASLQQVIEIDSQNPYNYAYLAFVYLYDWRPGEARVALNFALTINPNIPEIKALNGIAALMQGNLFRAWGYLFPLLQSSSL